MSKDIEFELQKAKLEANAVLQALLSACHKVSIAGSIRRQKESVHDIDVVLWPICEPAAVGPVDLFGQVETAIMPVKLMEVLRINGWWMQDEPVYPRKIALDTSFEREIIPVELYICETDGSNYGALLQMRTGSERFNISLAERAKRMGLQYKAGYGIFRDGARMDDGTEEGIFKALGLDWYPPEQRDADYRFMRAVVK